jgi:hypothetical protein
MVAAAVIGDLAVQVLVPAALRSFAMIAAVLILALYWVASRRAIANHEARRFSGVMHRGLLVANGVVIIIVAALKYKSSITPSQTVGGEANITWLQSEAMRQAGVRPGTSIAVVGSPFEAYWARTGRLRIVGVVPPLRVDAFTRLSTDKREMLLREFARVGARAVVSQTLTSPVPGDTSWVPRDFIGWVKRLPAH